MTLYRNGYLVFTINGHGLTTTFYWSLFIITKEAKKKVFLQGKKEPPLTKRKSFDDEKKEKEITRKGMTIYCKPEDTKKSEEEKRKG